MVRKNIKIIVHRSPSNIIRLTSRAGAAGKHSPELLVRPHPLPWPLEAAADRTGRQREQGEERGSRGEKEIRVWVRDPTVEMCCMNFKH